MQPTAPEQPITYAYRVESLIPGFSLIAVCIVIAAIATLLTLPPIIPVTCGLIVVGPLVYTGLQLIRRGRGVDLYPGSGRVALRRALFRKAQTVKFDELRGAVVTPSGGILIAAVITLPTPERTQPASTEYGPALNTLAQPTRPDADRPYRRHRIYLTAALDRASDLVMLLNTAIETHTPPAQRVSVHRLNKWAHRRKLRDYAYIVVLILGLPVYVYLISGLFRGFS